MLCGAGTSAQTPSLIIIQCCLLQGSSETDPAFFSDKRAGIAESVCSLKTCTLTVLHVRGVRGFICCMICRRNSQILHATCSILHHCLPSCLHDLLFSHGIVLDIAGIVGACTLYVRGIRGFICCKVCRRKTQTLHATCSIFFHHCLPYSLHGLLFSHSIVLNLPGAAHLCILQDLQAFGVKANSLLVAQLWKVVPKLSDKKLCMGFGSKAHCKDSRRSRCRTCPSISSGRKNPKKQRLKASVHTGYFSRRAFHQALVATWKQEQRLVVSSMRYEFFCLLPLLPPGKVQATSQIAVRKSFTNATQSSEGICRCTALSSASGTCPSAIASRTALPLPICRFRRTESTSTSTTQPGNSSSGVRPHRKNLQLSFV